MNPQATSEGSGRWRGLVGWRGGGKGERSVNVKVMYIDLTEHNSEATYESTNTELRTRITLTYFIYIFPTQRDIGLGTLSMISASLHKKQPLKCLSPRAVPSKFHT